MTLRTWCLVLGLALAGLAHAGDPPRRLEASRLVTGTIDVDAQGAVSGFVVNKRGKLPESVLAYLDSTIPRWRFEPVLVDGKPVAVHGDMSVRLVLRPLEAGQYALSIGGLHFDTDHASKGTRAESIRLTPPDYPADAMRRNGTGEVYLLLKVGREGKVEDAIAEQVNLLSYARTTDAEPVRQLLVEASIKQAIAKWTFRPPTVGEAADDPYWTVRVPVIFRIEGFDGTDGWKAYEPGPRRRAPWETPDDPPGFSPDALADGVPHQVGAGGLRLASMGASD